MNQRQLLIFGSGLTFALFGLVGASGPITRAQLWLAALDSAESAQAAALAPLIECANQYDVQWRLGYYTYGTHAVWRSTFAELLSNAKDFADGARTDMDTLPTRDCEPRMLYRLRHLEPDAPLLEVAQTYIDALHQANTARRAQSNRIPGAYMPATEELAEVARLQPHFDRYLQASTALRQALEATDIGARRQQQGLLENRLGRDIHWHLLGYMIQARDTVEQISRQMQEKTLSPERLATTSADLQRAWDAGQPLRDRPHDSHSRTASELWRRIERPAQHYQETLSTLHQDWLQQAAPQRLSEDYHAVTRAYDSLLSYYNMQARMDY